MKCNRREFLGKAAGLTLAGAAGLPLVCRCKDDFAVSDEPAPGEDAAAAARQEHPVVRLARPGLLDDRGRIDEKDAAGVIGAVLEELAPDDGEKGALESLFRPGERVGIKLNCLAGRGLSPQPPLVFALVSELVEEGIAPDDIIVFERSERELKDAGFPVGRRDGVRYLGNDSAGMGYDRRPLLHRSIGSCFCSILTREIDALINFGVLKDHNLAGVSVGLKNLFGLIHNPNKYHDDNCNPYVAHVLEAPPVRKKLRLTLCDGMTAQYQGGPGLMAKYTWRPGLFLASRDPVALDAVGGGIIERKRSAEGLPSLAEDGRAPAFIETAAECGLGTADPDAVRVVYV